MPTTTQPQRLLSLDVLRGADLFLLVFLQPIIITLAAHYQGAPFADFLLHELDHEKWVGFRFWDIIMPLFLFMSGVALPYSIDHYKASGREKAFTARLIRRFIILFLLGMVVQGNLLSLDFAQTQFYVNTLQSIAVGYLVTGFALLHVSVRGQVALMLSLLVVYWIPMTFCGDFSPEGNFASRIDAMLLGSHRGDPSYAWIWSSLNFCVTVMMGAFSCHVIRSTRRTPRKNAFLLFGIGAGCLVAGALWGLQMPIIKRLWTSSMTLYSGGICMMLLALFYYFIDVCDHRRHWQWLQYFGMNSIVAYMLGEWLNLRGVADQFTYGLAQFTGEAFYDVVVRAGTSVLIFLILQLMYRQKMFVKI